MSITGKAKIAGIFGWPISHSRSPRLHGHWLAEHGIDGAYVPLAVRPEHLADALRALPKLGFTGVNLTVPHKTASVPVMDALTPVAQRMGAVNTVIVQPDGSLTGDNTDAFGFMASLQEQAPDWQPGEASALILGAGGAARAVVVALQEAGVSRIRLSNRTTERAEALAQDLDNAIEIIPWAERDGHLADTRLLVNATTLGMAGQPGLQLEMGTLLPQAVVVDIVYTPLETPLLAAARRRGNPVVDGLGMLLHQARPGFRAWFGVDPQVTNDLRTVVLAD